MVYNEAMKLCVYKWRKNNAEKYKELTHKYYLENIDKFKKRANRFHSYNLWRKKLFNINLF